jgi:Holliday junction resolvasome RuvABC endonuclease subunit
MNNLKTIISLDLGAHTGWAIRHSDGHITSGTAHLQPRRAEGWGRRFLRFGLWLDELIAATDRVDAVYFEQVHRHLGTAAAHSYGGFLSHLARCCEHYKIPYIGVPVGTIKLFIAGKGNATKQEVITSVKALGHHPTDDNEADALALLHFALHTYKSRKPQPNQLNQTNV